MPDRDYRKPLPAEGEIKSKTSCGSHEICLPNTDITPQLSQHAENFELWRQSSAACPAAARSFIRRNCCCHIDLKSAAREQMFEVRHRVCVNGPHAEHEILPELSGSGARIADHIRLFVCPRRNDSAECGPRPASTAEQPRNGARTGHEVIAVQARQAKHASAKRLAFARSLGRKQMNAEMLRATIVAYLDSRWDAATARAVAKMSENGCPGQWTGRVP